MQQRAVATVTTRRAQVPTSPQREVDNPFGDVQKKREPPPTKLGQKRDDDRKGFIIIGVVPDSLPVTAGRHFPADSADPCDELQRSSVVPAVIDAVA